VARKKDPKTDVPDSEEDTPEIEDRDAELSENSDVHDALLDIYKDVEKGFADQWERSNDQMDWWDIYNSKLNSHQFYQGNSRIFVPIVHDAINARVTRFCNQIFPQSGRYVEVTSSDETIPHALMALLEHYVRKTRLRTKVMPALLRNGDVEGQYNLYITWTKNERHVVWRSTTEPIDGTEPVETIQQETITHQYPDVEVLADADVLVLPQSSDTIEDALANGGSVSILRRWSKRKIKKLMKAGELIEEEGKALCEEMSKPRDASLQPSKAKSATDAAGVKEGGKHALVYETWTVLNIRPEDGGEPELRLCRAYFGGEKQVLGCKRNPLWSDKCPLLSWPVEKVQGAFKGISKIKPVATIQYQANDAVNEAMDSAAYALLPIVMTDPVKNPRIGSMVLSLAAIWETSPNDTQFAKMPALWKEGLEIVAACRSQIMQTLGVNPSMLTQQSSRAKPSQADVAREQQVDILTTADAVTNVEEACLTPMLNRWVELDHQYRDTDLTVRSFGEMGLRANMQVIEPVQMERKHHFRWFGVEAARNSQQIQQQIAMTNVLRGIPPQQYEGYRLNLVPLISQLVENTFGPRLAPLIFEDMARQMPVPVEQEHMLLMSGFEVPTHQMDDDQQHLQAHAQLMQIVQQQGGSGGALKKIQTHIFAHMQQMARKQAMAAQQSQMGGMPGVPGGAGPGVAGTPRIGAQPGQPRFQAPPGQINRDQVSAQSGGMPFLRQRG